MGAALTKSFEFAVQTVLVCRQIQKTEKEFDLTIQLIKSCSSIGANLEEAEGASSKPDFRHKISLAYKEARIKVLA
jgi:four helix bundle protein